MLKKFANIAYNLRAFVEICPALKLNLGAEGAHLQKFVC
jgi:hypothetical protein